MAVKRRVPPLRRVPMLASVAGTRLLDDPAHAAAKIRTTMGGGSDASAADPVTSLEAACWADDPLTAMELLDRFPPGHPATARMTALVARTRGDLVGAQAWAQRAIRQSSGTEARRARGLLREIRAERAGLDPDWRPRMPRITPEPSTPDRILHVVTFALPQDQAGYTVRTQAVMTAQRDRGLDPQVVTRLGFPYLQGHWDAPDTDWVEGIPYHHLSPLVPFRATARGLIQRQVIETARLAKNLRPGVIHAATDYVNGRVALTVARGMGLPMAYEVRGFLEDSWLSRHDLPGAQETERYAAARELEAGVMRAADAVTTLGENMRSEIISRGADPHRVFVTPNGVDDRFLTAAPDRAAIRRRLGIRPEAPVIGTITTLFAHEGIETLLRAAVQLRSRYPDLRVLIVGDGPERSRLMTLAKQLRIDDLTVFPGRVPFASVEQWYAALDLFCVPRTDSRVTRLVTPLKPVEAMALRIPVLYSDLPALRELGQGRGWFAAADDPQAWAAAVPEVLDQPTERSRRIEIARHWVEKERSWAAIAETYEDVYAILGLVRT